jgi:hypothetical protein
VSFLVLALINNQANATGQTLVDQKIRFHHSEAGEVFIMWGVNGWYRAAEAQWPPGTVPFNDKNRYPYTPMAREGNAFAVTIQAPVGTTIDYVFNITKNSNGESIDVWDIYSKEVRDYHTTVIPDTIAEVYSLVPLEEKVSADPLATSFHWGVPILLVAICSIAGIIWLRRKMRNPFLDF